MPTWLWIVLAVVALVWASYLVAQLRYSGWASIKRFASSRSTPASSVDGVLYIPGILSPGPEGLLGVDDQVEGSLQALLQRYGHLNVLSYSDERSDNDEACAEFVRELRFMLWQYRRVTVVAASKGAMIVHNAMARFGANDRARMKLVLIDPPSGSKSLGLGGNIGAPIAWLLRTLLPIGHGMLLRWLPAPYGPPNASETQDGLNFKAVKRTAMQRYKGFTAPIWWGDLAWMATFRLKAANLTGFGGGVHYIVCTLGNVTVKQPLAVDAWRRACPDLNVVAAAMPHCGWLQQPIEAERVFRAALDAPWK